MPETSLGRRQREQVRHRREVLASALQLFAEKGFHATTVQEVAQAAEFGVGTLYRLFPGGKDEIYLALKQRVVAAFEQELEYSFRGADAPLEQVRRYIKASAQVYASHPREMALYFQETAGAGFDLSRGLPDELASHYRACNERALKALAAAASQGLLRDLEPQAALLFLRMTLNGFLMNWLQSPLSQPLEQTLRLVESVFFHGVLAPTAGQPPA